MQESIRDDESREVSLGPDRLSAALRGELRALVERWIREERVEALGAERDERAPERRGHQHSPRERTVTTGLGPLTVPRGRWFTPEGGSKEWRSALLPRYARRTREVDAALAVVESLEEAGEALLTFYRFPASQWKGLRTTNIVERVIEEFRRRVKTQAVLPNADSAMLLLYGLVASGQLKSRMLDGYQELDQVGQAAA